MGSFALTLESVSRHLPPALVPAEALARVSGAVAGLPAAVSSWWYLECRLAEASPQVDAILLIDRDAGTLMADPATPLPPALARHPVWMRLRSFCRQWIDPRSPLHRTVDHLWVELDVGEEWSAAPEPPVPGVFLSFGDVPDAAAPIRDRPDEVIGALGPLLAGPLPGAIEERLRLCLEKMPPGAHVPYFALMLSRGPIALRLCVSHIAPTSVGPYLSAIGWSGCVGDVIDLASRVPGPGRAPSLAMIHLDVGEVVGPRVGLEYSFERRQQLETRGAAERCLLDLLVARGLCSPAKRDGLLAWPGFSYEKCGREFWTSLRMRHFNHVKIVCDTEGKAEAKGYLLTYHRPASAMGGRVVPRTA